MITPISFMFSVMRPNPQIKPFQVPSFQGKFKMNGGNPDLKRLWDAGKLPSVKYGFYGDKLTHENCTREHLQPASQGGTKRFGNIVLASKQKNNARGNDDITKYATLDNVRQYLGQFIQLKNEFINGHKYIKEVLDTLQRLGLKFQ